MASNNDNNDITIVESDSSSDDDSQSSEEFNFAVALQLRKNLSSTFDKHIHSSSSVTDKIARFEQQQQKQSTAAASNKLPPRQPRTAATTTVVKSTPLGVYLRVRPLSSNDKNDAQTATTLEIQPTVKPTDLPTTVRTYPPVDSNAAKAVREDSNGGVKEFEFSQVFGPDSSQNQIYGTVAAPLVTGLFPSASSSPERLVGESALLFAYGITNAGKTHTIMGNTKESQQWGVIPRALQDIFSHMEQRSSTNYSLSLSYMEIYNEGIYDLLPKESSTKKFVGASRESLKLRESQSGQTFVRGLTKHKVTSVAEGLQLAQQASTKRHTSSNNINAGSSRSHCICQLELSVVTSPPVASINDDADDDNSTSAATSGYSTDDEAARLIKARDKTVTLWIVDLAGSERSKRTGVLQGSVRQKEAALINASLMKLMRCLSVMRRNQSLTASTTANVVPFRESKLTHLFMNHLTGPSANRTLMIVNVNPAVADFDETQHVLAYATAARTVQISQDEVHRKRKGEAATSGEATHDYNGRALKKFKSSKGTAVPASHNNNDANKPQAGVSNKISKLVRHFSPKKLAAKESRKRKMTEAKTGDGAGSSRSLTSYTAAELKQQQGGRLATMRAQGKPKAAPLPHGGDSQKELKQLKMSLSIAQAEAEVLRSEKSQLEEQLSQQEAQIRMELAQDMEEQMRVMREQYDDIIDNLKSQVQAVPTPAKSVKKAQMDRAEEHLEELMDKVDECEDEMKRQREAHAAEIASLQEEHGKAIQMKDNELLQLTSSHKGAVAKLEATIRDLKEELKLSREAHAKLEKSKKEMMENYEQLIREQDDEEEEDSEDDEEEESKPTPVRRGRQQQQSKPTEATRRLPRNRRTSKVAVQTMDTDNVPKSSGKRPRRRTRSKRTPLSPIAIHQNSSDSDDSFGPDKWLRPSKPVERCESTGSYLRPRGRAPNGREWDPTVGAWRLSMAE